VDIAVAIMIGTIIRTNGKIRTRIISHGSRACMLSLDHCDTCLQESRLKATTSSTDRDTVLKKICISSAERRKAGRTSEPKRSHAAAGVDGRRQSTSRSMDQVRPGDGAASTSVRDPTHTAGRHSRTPIYQPAPCLTSEGEPPPLPRNNVRRENISGAECAPRQRRQTRRRR